MTNSTSKNKPTEFSQWKIFYYLTFVAGCGAMVLEIDIYRVTIIRVIIPISIILFVGLATFLISRNHYKRTFDVRSFLLPLVQNIISWGFIACYLFMATNYYLADNERKNLSFLIESKSSLPGTKGRRHEKQPLVIIDYFGVEKELFFLFKDTERVENADKVNVRI
jgi:hypothetical protein